ncbi:protein DA1-related 2 isoform X4 [Salvia divinorum]|uniref:Protein DA1-related 2 isoform X4 n=1 Tax=Salvia divinorum TaxID=28513 RepID=A0ABD1GKS1_SALDI
MSSSNANHLSHSCIYERKSSFMKWMSKFFKSGRAAGVFHLAHSNISFSGRKTWRGVLHLDPWMIALGPAERKRN